MKLSKNFYLIEFLRSSTAAAKGIRNVPHDEDIERMQDLCFTTLQPLRDAVNSVLHIGSGYRSPELNAAIGGDPHSQHMIGEAADITSSHYKVEGLILILIKLGIPFDQCINEFGGAWLHVSLTRRRKLRSCVYEAYRDDNGITRYRDVTVRYITLAQKYENVEQIKAAYKIKY